MELLADPIEESASLPLSGARILCVDDCPAALEYLRSIFAEAGAQVIVAKSAEDAIKLLEKERFDLLFSDLSMAPGLDGYDLVHALRDMEANDAERQPTPTAAVSGDATRPSRKRRFADFQVYLSKPVSIQKLLKTALRLLDAAEESVELGSLRLWEADLAAEAAKASSQAAEALVEASKEATAAASLATTAAASGTNAALMAEEASAKASSKAAPW